MNKNYTHTIKLTSQELSQAIIDYIYYKLKINIIGDYDHHLVEDRYGNFEVELKCNNIKTVPERGVSY